jgi:plasmid stabilization system protein ParE
MDFRVHFQKRALKDLERLVRYIAQDDPITAERFGLGLVMAAEHRATAPESGTPYDTKRGLRSFPFGPYRVYYRVLHEQKTLEVLKIWHGMREHMPKL